MSEMRLASWLGRALLRACLLDSLSLLSTSIPCCDQRARWMFWRVPKELKGPTRREGGKKKFRRPVWRECGGRVVLMRPSCLCISGATPTHPSPAVSFLARERLLFLVSPRESVGRKA